MDQKIHVTGLPFSLSQTCSLCIISFLDSSKPRIINSI